MDQQEKQELGSTLPVVSRLDRVDRVLHLLEEKHNQSRRNLSNDVFIQKAGYPVINEAEDPRKTLSSTLEEVDHKGTLLERLAVLENRVVQLSLEMDEGNTSRSSSSTNVLISDNNPGHDPVWSTITAGTAQDDHRDEGRLSEKQPHSVVIQKEFSAESGVEKTGRKRSKREFRKYFGRFRMGC